MLMGVAGMIPIKNNEIRKLLAEITKLEGYRDEIPFKLDDKLMPTLDATPDNHRLCNFMEYGQLQDDVSTVIVTTDEQLETYLTGIFLSWTKDVVTTTQTITIHGYVDGTQRSAYLLKSSCSP
jgi:hypothetical protein